MQKEIQKILRKYKVIATADDYTVTKDIIDAVLDCINTTHKIVVKDPEKADN